MNVEILREALAVINGEIYKAESQSEDLENLRKSLCFQVMYIEQRQCQIKQVA